ncbi:hypothetical protein O181_121289 [Austropuccinia psidii MF-1]|uniref:HAT C-terminal dimerisation domain-containing protein n=1 Tax=Austropuccinia psidii MF-1 TaxID=1389203 RepID=A0A9Q3KKV2_9BASI|nr:hypothetical protein [Austropuccinia psidii MF-1]
MHPVLHLTDSLPLNGRKAQVIVGFLEPLYKATNLISGSNYPTISHALPLYIVLMKIIHLPCARYDVVKIDPAAKAMTMMLSKYLRVFLTKIPVICATVIDTRFKLRFLQSHNMTLARFGTSATNLAGIFEDQAQKHFRKDITTSNEPSYNTSKSTGLFDKMYSSSNASDANSLDNELTRFVSEPPEPKTTDILLFWKSRQTFFPTLGLMAHKFLSIPATSVPSECVFSGGRKISNYQQASLSPMHIEQLACVKDWAHNFGPLYSDD